ncbi:MAG: hypothetical protein P1U68_17680 [Verrucomicrobiales bacterium]|nr:hypothetical protein [Verrucomicrobiales bacterium]
MSIFDELSVSFENPATDAMGYDVVEGQLLCRSDELVLQFKQKDRAFRKNPIQSVAFSYSEIEGVEFHGGWFKPKRLVLRTDSPEKLSGFPGAGVGSVELFVQPESVPGAKKVFGIVDFRKSENRLAASEARLNDRSEKS